MSVDPPSADARSHTPGDLVDLLSRHVVGQADAVRFIVPYIEMYQAGFAPERRPAGIFLLLGPTGTGKTRTVEALAEVLHGTPNHVLTINCGEFQSDHEVARLVGAPPGYVGHRESAAMLSSDRLAAVASPGCDLSLVLFDEIEKAAPALTTLLLGILDRATLTLGDGREVDFSRTLIFLTSNLGAREMTRVLEPGGMGFQGSTGGSDASDRLEAIALGAVRRRFSPEFVNRIDVVVTYRPLDEEALDTILSHHADELERHVSTRLGERSFTIRLTKPARELLLARGTSQEYGARELKRVIHRLLTQPLAARVARGQVPPAALVLVGLDANGTELSFDITAGPPAPPVQTAAPAIVLVVDDNEALAAWMMSVLAERGYDVRTATTAADGRAASTGIDVAVLDYLLPDGDGVALGAALQQGGRAPAVVIVSGLELSDPDRLIVEARGFVYLQKPFMDDDLIRAVESVHLRAAAQGA